MKVIADRFSWPPANRWPLFATALVLALLAALAQPFAGEPADEALKNSTWNPLNRDSAGHFRVADPANVSAAEAEAVYQELARSMAEVYGLSGLAFAAAYQSWPRYNTAPYRSVTHGKRYLNNYANAAGRAYGRFEDAGVMPAGTVLAKDSFSVSKSGEVLVGPLFAMEKMEPGFNPASADWRYTLVLPDGSILGATKGENSDNVAFCVACHAAAGRGQDHMFFPRRKYRTPLEARAD
ncbi:MAG: hypothetical protein V3T29_04365 [Alphaproteobacteria bacterium]